ncbi:MAG: hypothetical protein R3D71_10355 [Rickettsiales bacterium]
MFTPISSITATTVSSTLALSPLPNSSSFAVNSNSIIPADIVQNHVNSTNRNKAVNIKNSSENSFPTNESTNNYAPRIANNNNYLTPSNSRAIFLTQLASGDISPEIQGIFAQYNKLISYANVKYKPSNAGKPNIDPNSIFSLLLRQKDNSPSVNITQKPQATQINSIVKINYTANTDDTQNAETDIVLDSASIINFLSNNENETNTETNKFSARINPYVETIIRNNNIPPSNVQIA